MFLQSMTERVSSPLAPLGSGGASPATCGVPSPSKQRTVKLCLPLCMGQLQRHTTQVWPDNGVRSSAGAACMASGKIELTHWKRDKLRLRFIVKRFAQNPGQALLSLGNPSAIVFADHVFGIAQQFSDIPASNTWLL